MIKNFHEDEIKKAYGLSNVWNLTMSPSWNNINTASTLFDSEDQEIINMSRRVARRLFKLFALKIIVFFLISVLVPEFSPIKLIQGILQYHEHSSKQMWVCNLITIKAIFRVSILIKATQYEK